MKFKRLNIEQRLLKHSEPSNGEVFWTADRVRDTFVSFFESRHQHVNYKSAPVVPLNDPTLLFINAGMAQFKPIFLGQVAPTSPLAALKRACNTQKCIRAGGKHNDLDDVGKDSYHHTFFEMLGNWSFGDYFKEEAIDMAWTLLTKVYKLPEDRLYVTYFEGDDTVPVDDEAKALWGKYVPADRILPGDAKDNFWEMGATGPCGPCSEIHFDRIGGRHAADLVNKDDPNVIEIWNLVFMQFNRKADQSLERLPAKHVDTGMGFERLLSILQGKTSNYATDLFAPIFKEIEAKLRKHQEGSNLTVQPYQDKYDEEDVGKIDMAYRVLADHIRTLTVAIADGALPSNEGRGYVLRRIIRRAVRFAQDILKMPKNSFSSLVPVAIVTLENAFPELKKKQRYIIDVIRDEETVFERTLKKGVDHFERQSTKLLESGASVVPGELVFKLYESMGFPKDLTQLMAEEKGLEVDLKGYDECMKRHIEISKQVKKKNDVTFKVFEAKETSELETRKVKPTLQEVYVEADLQSQIVAIYDASEETFVDQLSLKELKNAKDSFYGIILDKSSMYFESGGQIGDEGWLRELDQANDSTGTLFNVLDVQNSKGYIIHIGKINLDYAGSCSNINVGDEVLCCVDYAKRDKVKKNHTATHVLNWGLRQILGLETDQAGSLVNEDYLRFDFTSKRPMKTAEVARLEDILKEKIEESEDIDSDVVPLADAKKVKALRAVFGETYPDPVRVVAIGCKVKEVLKAPDDPKWFNYSIELCGGTHVSNSSVIKRLVVMSEEAKGKNIRRMICLTEEKALKAWSEGEQWYQIVKECQDNEIKPLSDKISNAELPLTQRRELLEILNKKKVVMMESEKQRLNELVAKITSEAVAQRKGRHSGASCGFRD